MHVVSFPAAFFRIARHPPQDLSPKAQERLRWLNCWQALRQQRLSARKASEVLGLPRSTLYRWQIQLNECGLKGLEDKSRRPKHFRQPMWDPKLVDEVLRLREEYPRWGKDKLVILIKRKGWQVSTSTVGRILSYLKARGVLKEPSLRPISTRRRKQQRPYAIRKPKDYQAKSPGDLVEIDTLDVRPLPGVIVKHFGARDVVSRWDVMNVYTRATAAQAASFLDILGERMPFPIKALQVDGGSEFASQFETECQRRGILLFVLPPHSPKLNGHVERAHRTHTEEFYEVYDGEFDIPSLREALERWEWTYNHVRPSQALNWKSPAEYLIERHPELASIKTNILALSKLSNM
jgi:putative transposase